MIFIFSFYLVIYYIIMNAAVCIITGHLRMSQHKTSYIMPRHVVCHNFRIILILYSAIIGQGKILEIDCHLPMFYLPIFSLPVIYSIGAYFDNLMLELLSMLDCCYIILSYIIDVDSQIVP